MTETGRPEGTGSESPVLPACKTRLESQRPQESARVTYVTRRFTRLQIRVKLVVHPLAALPLSLVSFFFYYPSPPPSVNPSRVSRVTPAQRGANVNVRREQRVAFAQLLLFERAQVRARAHSSGRKATIALVSHASSLIGCDRPHVDGGNATRGQLCAVRPVAVPHNRVSSSPPAILSHARRNHVTRVMRKKLNRRFVPQRRQFRCYFQ